MNACWMVMALSLTADGGMSAQAPNLDLGIKDLGLGADAGTAAAPPKKKGPDVTHMHFDKDGIRAVVSYHAKEVQDCYEKVIAEKEKKIEGRVLVDFVVDSEGKVKDAKVAKKGTTLKEDRVHECVVTLIYDWEFPKPGDGRDHPLQFPFDLKYVK